METTAPRPELLMGALHLPSAHAGTADHRAWLASHGVVAALGDPTADGPATLNVALLSGRPVVVLDGVASTPWSVLELFAALTDAAGGLVEVPEYRTFVGDKSLEARGLERASRSVADTVLLSRPAASGGAPGFVTSAATATRVGQIRSATVDGWTLTHFDRAISEVGLDWAVEELPAVWLLGDRTVALQTTPGPRPDLLLRHWDAPTPVLEEVPPACAPAQAALRDPQTSAVAEVWNLSQEPAFAHVDPAAVAVALQATPDAQWSAGVLAALGVPVLAADVAEGRAHVPDQSGVSGAVASHTGELGELVAALQEIEQADMDDVGANSLAVRLYGTSRRHPLLALATIVPEILVGVALLVALAGASEHPWWHWLVGILAVACLLDAAIDSVMMVRRLRRRR